MTTSIIAERTSPNCQDLPSRTRPLAAPGTPRGDPGLTVDDRFFIK
jgi:hypothetical protein